MFKTIEQLSSQLLGDLLHGLPPFLGLSVSIGSKFC